MYVRPSTMACGKIGRLRAALFHGSSHEDVINFGTVGKGRVILELVDSRDLQIPLSSIMKRLS